MGLLAWSSWVSMMKTLLSHRAPPSVTRVTAVLAHSSGELLLVPDDYIGRRNLEHVEVLQENPINSNQVAIGYGRGLIVIWDLEQRHAIRHIPATQVTENLDRANSALNQHP
ncbi:hypothetical protein XENOCAPTIV_005592 [Xenoophorus captivus]|uniref:Uncharacterized protein n=1 Tax=Xenoophorus captivus TaxID=1517983 RepID=A0ABV0R747_9TELE